MLVAVYNSLHAALWYKHQFNTTALLTANTCSVHQAKMSLIEPSNAIDILAFYCIKKGGMGEEGNAL